MSRSTGDSSPPVHNHVLKTLAHDLGNLAYRLTFLAENLKREIPDAARRDEALALLEDTTARLRDGIATLKKASES